ncbi:MAG: M18 family aminopeptidase [Clostridia bacterium]|nr:M18 family aminopeptidase [Clostridia bacterium]
MENTQKLIEFIEKSTDCYHAVKSVRERLEGEGFTELCEDGRWTINEGGKYYVVRNYSSVIAFKVPEKNYKSFLICASHTDSPCFKLKSNFEISAENMVKLSVEGYGGMIMSSWLDRPLSVSGRVVTVKDGKVQTRLVNIDRDLLMIPNLAIHMSRDINKGYEFNVKRDMCPLAGGKDGALMDIVAENAGVKKDDIKGFDLSLYNRMRGTVTGTDNEYFSAPRIDDLQCVYTTLEGFFDSESENAISVFAAFDNEEVGSGTKQGAKSGFLRDTLERINAALGGDEEDYKRAVPQSFMLSCDNAHAVHPNHADKSDSANRVYMNGGIVIKYNANQRYTTDAVSEAVVKYVCEKADVPYQLYANRSDIPGGSTLGNLSNEKVSLNTADIGLAQLAMHSAYETAGSKDTTYMINFVKTFYESNLEF